MKKLKIGEEKGTALAITLLIIVTLVGIAVGFADDSNVELSLAAYSRDDYRSLQATRAGFNLAIALLDQDEDLNMDSFLEDWGKLNTEGFPEGFLEDAKVTGKIIDENGKININFLRTTTGEIDEKVKERIERLLDLLGMEESSLNPLLDWLDEDDITRLDGAENLFYQGLDYPYECANGPFLTVGQVSLVKGFESLARPGSGGESNFLDYLTVYSNGKINVNTAPKEVLQSLDGEMDGVLVDSILEYRREQNFSSINDLKNVPGMYNELFNRIRNYITVQSVGFSIELEGRCQEAAARIRAIVIRNGQKHKLVYWLVS